jgi:tetratricopeptide (TPR) repeat protein
MSSVIRLGGLLLVCCFAATAAAQDGLTRARDLYESAAYEEALAELGRLKADAAIGSAPEVDRYRALCLMALNRAAEADKVIESIVVSDPLYQPAATDASPRVRTAFSVVRQRVLPGVARQLYMEAKGLFDRKAYREAAQALERTVMVIDNVDAANKDDLADLRLLASGFLDLARAGMAPPASAPAPTAAVSDAASTSPATPPARTASPPAPLPLSTEVVVLKQDMPPLPFALANSGKQEYSGLVEVQIDVTGRVGDVRILQSVHALYDPMLLKAAREWLYEPLRVAGKPTASRKRVQVVLRP